MKKSFLIAGLIACIGATNGYAAIVVSQDDAPDITISVARSAKRGGNIPAVPAAAQIDGVNTILESSYELTCEDPSSSVKFRSLAYQEATNLTPKITVYGYCEDIYGNYTGPAVFSEGEQTVVNVGKKPR